MKVYIIGLYHVLRSRQQWYGNTDPEHQGVVTTEIAHVWPGVRQDQILYTSESITQVSRHQEPLP